MSTQPEAARELLNNINIAANKAKLGDYLVDGLEAAKEAGARQGPAVADSTEAASPTTAEFNALLASLRAAGLIAAE